MSPSSPPNLPDPDSLAGLEWPRLWELLCSRLATAQGAAAAGQVEFLDDAAAIRGSLAMAGEAMELLREDGALDFGGTHELAHLLERVSKGGPLEGTELLQVLTTLQTAAALAATLAGRADAPALNALAADFQPEPELLKELGMALTPAGELNEKTYPDLSKLRRKVSRKRDVIHQLLDAMLRSRALAPVLQEKIYTLRGNRYVLPVKVDFKGQLPGIVHDVSASGATLFIEPHAVVDESNDLTMLEKQIEARQAEILAQLSTSVGDSAPALWANLGWLGRVDLMHAQAALALDYGGTIPRVEEQGEISLVQVANPLMLVEGENPVRNDFTLGAQAHCMVISGANTGGKTVVLKTIGLCALLVRAGMPIPAGEGSRFDLFHQVRADIGDQQSLSQSLSTFSAQIRFITETLAAGSAGITAARGSAGITSAGGAGITAAGGAQGRAAGGAQILVLIDEMLTGTAPAEGAALAVTLLSELAHRGMRCIATSHYGELKELAAEHPGMVNASVAFDLEKLAPTYRLITGTPGASYAFPIARRHGLAENLVASARQQLEERPATADALLTQLHSQEQELSNREAVLAKSERETATSRRDLEARRKQLAQREWELRQQEQGKVSKELEAARLRIAEVIKALQGANSLPLAAKVRKQLDDAAEELLAPIPPPEPAPPPLQADALKAGDAVLLRSLNQVAVLEAVHAKRKRATVRLGSLGMEVELAELVLPPAGARPTGALRDGAPRGGTRQSGTQQSGDAPGSSAPGRGSAARGTTEIGFVLSTEENTLDLRGNRLEAALERTEAFCDLSVVKHVSPLLIIHGHGTGKLKAGIRDWLTGNPYVAAFRPGGTGEGGDGVSVVALNL